MTNNPPVSWSDFNRVVAALSAQISALEKRLDIADRHRHYFKSGDGMPRATNPPHDVGEVRARSQFIPDYDSEGAY